MAKNTRFFGSNEPLQIFQDDIFDCAAPMTGRAPMPTVTKPARRPLGSANSNVVLNPPSTPGATYSPHKTKSSPRSPLRASQGGNKLHAVSMAPPLSLGNSTDSLKKPFLSKFKTGPQKPATDVADFGKENVHPHIFPPPAAINLSVEEYYQKPNGKRGLMDAAPISQGPRPAKKAKAEEASLPPHDSFPPIADDGTKPAHSYAQLIGMAILRSPMRRLTLAQIYKWISDNFSFYNPNDAGWQNSIRHNLSLHKNFIKIERPKDDPGKGNYWGIEPGTEFQFLKEKPTRKSAPSAENLPVMSTRLEPSRPATAPPISEPCLPPPAPMSQHSLPALPPAQAPAAEPSSDATIPVSDGAAPDDIGDKGPDTDFLLDSSMYSPIPANMHSSPPISRMIPPRSRTPTGASRHHGSSVSRPRKRKNQSTDDSGYISSLESSAMRPNQNSYLLTSEADRPAARPRRLTAGRAEEEIARIRNSSPYSPTKGRSNTTFGPLSSSPLRPAAGAHMLAPLTPNVRMKPPMRPPPSASPNTTLRLHRDQVQHMLQSPLRKVVGIADDSAVPWSPAFNLDETIYHMDEYSFDPVTSNIFEGLTGIDDDAFGCVAIGDVESPIKKSTKRGRLERTISTPSLGGVDGRKSITSAPLLRLTEQSPMQFLETPSKVFEGMSSPLKHFQQSPSKNLSPTRFMGLEDMNGENEWPALMLDPSQFISSTTSADVADYAELDILQGFQKIGSGSGSKPKQNKNTKPPLGRSFSTAF
jgi:forkhead transcription factor HCM1